MVRDGETRASGGDQQSTIRLSPIVRMGQDSASPPHAGVSAEDQQNAVTRSNTVTPVVEAPNITNVDQSNGVPRTVADDKRSRETAAAGIALWKDAYGPQPELRPEAFAVQVKPISAADSTQLVRAAEVPEPAARETLKVGQMDHNFVHGSDFAAQPEAAGTVLSGTPPTPHQMSLAELKANIVRTAQDLLKRSEMNGFSP